MTEIVLDPGIKASGDGLRNANGTLVRKPTATSFDDITGKAVTEIVENGLELKITFTEELTEKEKRGVIRRALQTAEQEQLDRQAKTAVGKINTYLGNTALTAADDRAQVKLLSRVVKQLILMVVPDASDPNPSA